MEGGARDPYDVFWTFGLMIAAPFMAWWVWSDVGVFWAFRVKLGELWLIETLGLGSAWTAELAGALRGALTAPEKISFETFLFGLEAVGEYLRGPVALALIVLGGWLIMAHPAERFRRRFDLRQLAEAMGAQWPFALHALRRGNLGLSLDHPRWGMALSGPAFLRRHALWVKTDTGDCLLREAEARQVLAEQLGPPWSTVPLSLHVRALAGLFALRATSFVTASDQEAHRLKNRTFALLRDLALAAANHKKGDYLPPPAAYEQVIQETAPFLNADSIQTLIAHHAYTATVLLRLLAEARRSGVLPGSLFNWLKGVDRPLWYALCSLGRRTPFAEALGTVAHYQAERQMDAPLFAPAVSTALEGLRLDLRNIPPEP